MLKWRNLLFTAVIGCYLHSCGAALCFRLGEPNLGSFCVGFAILLGLVSMPLYWATRDQHDSYAEAQADQLRAEVEELQKKLLEKEADL